jgi:hypothetical protein
VNPPPERDAEHDEVPVTVTALALSVVDARRVLLDADTQSPTLMADLLAVVTRVKRVTDPNATSETPLVVVTFAPALPTDVTLPATAFIGNARFGDLPPAAPELLGPPDPALELDPHAASTIALAARVTPPTRRRRWEIGKDKGVDTGCSLARGVMGHSLRNASMGARRAARVAG